MTENEEKYEEMKRKKEISEKQKKEFEEAMKKLQEEYHKVSNYMFYFSNNKNLGEKPWF